MRRAHTVIMDIQPQTNNTFRIPASYQKYEAKQGGIQNNNRIFTY